MLQLSGLFCVLFCNLCYGFGEEEEYKVTTSVTPDFQYVGSENEVENLIEQFQDLAGLSEQMRARRRTDEVKRIYKDMIIILDTLIDTVGNSNNAHKFLKAKGIDRIATNYLKIEHDDLKARVLILLKVLFDVAPTTTNAIIPIVIVDRLLSIFENDNLALKAHSLDVLYLWLPDNPRVQARVMKLKGLQPFYAQISKLDTNIIKLLLKLFNKILIEHLDARSVARKNVIDADKLEFYQRVGLIERMSTPVVCNGLLNIFLESWSYNSNDNNIIFTIFELMKNVKQFCIEVFRGKVKALRLFTALQDYVQGPENKEKIVLNGLNVTDVTMVIEDYVDKLKHTVKDEL